MTKEYIQKEVDLIFEKNSDKELASALSGAWIIANFKGVNIKIYKTDGLNPLADYFVVGSVQNKTQAQSIASTLGKIFRGKLNVKSVEGASEAEWILVDTGDVIVHIFQETFRDIYDLDKLWTEYPQIKIPNEYYHSNPSLPEENDSEKDLKNYF